MQSSFKRFLAIVICVSLCPLAGTALAAGAQPPKKNVKFVVTPQVVTVVRNDAASPLAPAATTTATNGGGGIFGNPNFLMLALGGAVVVGGVALLASGVFNRQPTANTTSSQVASDFVNVNTYTPPADITPKQTPVVKTPAPAVTPQTDVGVVTVQADDPQVSPVNSGTPGFDLATNPVNYDKRPALDGNQQQKPADNSTPAPAKPVVKNQLTPPADIPPKKDTPVAQAPLNCIDNASQIPQAAPQLQKVIGQMGGEQNMNAQWNAKANLLVTAYDVSVFFHSGPNGLFGEIVNNLDKSGGKPHYEKASVCVNDDKSLKLVVHEQDGDKVSVITPGNDLNHISIASDASHWAPIPFNRIGDNSAGPSSQVAAAGTP